MAASLDDDLGVPPSASLLAKKVQAILKAESVSIPVGPESLRENDNTRRSLLVGRQAATADLRIQHGSISRKHAVFYYSDSSLMLTDLGGKHGTTVNEQRIPANKAIEIQEGDRILFGNVRESIFTVKIIPKEVKGAAENEPLEVKEALSSQQKADQSILERAGEGLTGRAKRQAEISAMMASLDQAPTYEPSKVVPLQEEKQSSHSPTFESANNNAVVTKFRLPVTKTFRISSESGDRNAVSALAIDPAGSRFVVGTTDNSLRYYDFSGMNQGRQDAFRSVIPDEGHWPVSCAFSNTGDRLIVGTGSVQPVVLDREGQEVIQFVRGDMYVTDKSKTTGHTAAVTAVDWHPLEREWVLTSSIDGSARLWNLSGRTQFKKLVCDKVFSPKNLRGQRTNVTTVCFHPGGREFAVGTSCGSIQIWSRTRVSGRPERAVYAAHGENKTITSLVFNVDGSRLASRSVDDDQVKVWNPQRLSRSSQPLVICRSAPTVHDHASMSFSPNGQILCVTVAESRRVGRLHFYGVSEKESVVDSILSLDCASNSSPTLVKWHPRVNQIFVGYSDGHALVFYDSNWSKKGALLAASKVGRAVDDLSALLNSRAPTGSAGISGEIVTPFSLPMYRQDQTTDKKRKREERKDPVKSREPERPATGKHKAGGQAGGSTSFAMFVADQRVTTTKPIAGKDPREALFQYNEGKSFVNRAYEGNESKLADKTAEEEFHDKERSEK